MNPGTGKLQCTQCDSVLNPSIGEESAAMTRTEDGELVDKRSYKNMKKAARIKRYVTEPADTIYTLDEIHLGADQDSPKYMDMNLYECTSCGARLMVTAHETSSFCAYCGQPMVLVDRVTNELEPDLIIPFGISQRRAEQLIRERFGKGWFVPDDIKNLQVDKIRGIYIPYWLTSVHVRKKIKYTISETRKKETDLNGILYGRHSKFYISSSDDTEVIIHHCMKDCECTISRIPSDSSRRLNDNISHRLEPYDTSKALDFSPEYLSGFYTDRYDVPAAEVISQAKKRSDSIVKEEMLGKDSKDRKISVTSDETESKLEDVEYALFPAWFMTFRYQGILYTVAVNGQNGKVVGNVPANRFKVGASIGILAILMCVACTFLSVFAGNMIFYSFEEELPIYLIMGYIMVVVSCVGYFWKAVNKLHRSRIDIHRFRSYGTIEYIKERQDKTWVR